MVQPIYCYFGASDKEYYVGRFTREIVSDKVNSFIVGIIGFICGVAVQV